MNTMFSTTQRKYEFKIYRFVFALKYKQEHVYMGISYITNRKTASLLSQIVVFKFVMCKQMVT